MFSPFRIFEQLALALKFFTVLNIFFIIQGFFEQLCACLENRFCPEIFLCIEYFYIQDF